MILRTATAAIVGLLAACILSLSCGRERRTVTPTPPTPPTVDDCRVLVDIQHRCLMQASHHTRLR